MSRRRPSRCRRPFVPPAVSSDEPRSGREVIEEALYEFTAIGRQMVTVTTAALVDAAAQHGFDGPEWEPASIRPEIVEIVGSRMHNVLVDVMRPDRPAPVTETCPSRVRQDVADHRPERLQAALVDQLFSMVATECEQYGLYPASDHADRLRECLQDLVSTHWSDSAEHGAQTSVKSVLLTERIGMSNTVVPLLREHDPE